MLEKVYWISNRELTADEEEAIRQIHGAQVHVEHIADDMTLNEPDDLAEMVALNDDGFVYADAGPQHYLAAVGEYVQFGFFADRAAPDHTGGTELAVYHWNGEYLDCVWPPQQGHPSCPGK